MKTIMRHLSSTIGLWLLLAGLATANHTAAPNVSDAGGCFIHALETEVISCSNLDYDLEVTISYTGEGLLQVGLNGNTLGSDQITVHTTTASTTTFSFSNLPSTGEVVQVTAALTDDECDTEPFEFTAYTSPSGCCSLDDLTATAACAGAAYDLAVVATFTKSSPVKMDIVLTNSGGTVLASQFIPSAQSGEPIVFENLTANGGVVQVQATIYGKGCDSPKTERTTYTAPSGCCEVIFGEIYTECEDLEYYSLTTEIGYLGQGPFNLSVQLDGGNLGTYSDMVNNGATTVTFNHLPSNGNAVVLSATVSGGSCQVSQNWTSLYTPPSCHGPCGVQFVGTAIQCENADEYTANFEIHYTGHPALLQLALEGGATAVEAIAATSSPQTITLYGLEASDDYVEVTTTASGGDCTQPESYVSAYLLTPDDCSLSPVGCTINNLSVTPVCTGENYKTEVRVSFSSEESRNLQISLNDGQLHQQIIYPSTSPAVVYFPDLTAGTGTVQVQVNLNGASCLSTQTANATYTAPNTCQSTDCTLNKIDTDVQCHGSTYDLTAYLYYTGQPGDLFVRLQQQGQQSTTHEEWQQSIEASTNPAIITFKNLPVDGQQLDLSASMSNEAEDCKDRISTVVTAPASCPCQVDTVVYEEFLNGNYYDLKTKVFFAADGQAKLKVALSNGLSQERMVDFSPATFWFEGMACEGTPVVIETQILEGDCGDQVATKTVVFREPLNCDAGMDEDTYCPEDCPITIGETYQMSAAEIAQCTDSGIAEQDIKVCYAWRVGTMPYPTEDICMPSIEVCPNKSTIYVQIVSDNCGNILAEREYPVEMEFLEVHITPNPVGLCPGESEVTIDAGKFFESYQWSNGANTRKITVNQTGIYSVTVTGALGCQAIDEVEVTLEDAPFEVVITPTEALVCPDVPVALRADIMGNFPPPGGLTYEWSTGETAASIMVSEVGTYEVTVTDGQGCEASVNILVNSADVFAQTFFENLDFVILPIIEIEEIGLMPQNDNAHRNFSNCEVLDYTTAYPILVREEYLNGNTQVPFVLRDKLNEVCLSTEEDGTYIITDDNLFCDQELLEELIAIFTSSSNVNWYHISNSGTPQIIVGSNYFDFIDYFSNFEQLREFLNLEDEEVEDNIIYDQNSGWLNLTWDAFHNLAGQEGITAQYTTNETINWTPYITRMGRIIERTVGDVINKNKYSNCIYSNGLVVQPNGIICPSGSRQPDYVGDVTYEAPDNIWWFYDENWEPAIYNEVKITRHTTIQESPTYNPQQIPDFISSLNTNKRAIRSNGYVNYMLGIGPIVLQNPTVDRVGMLNFITLHGNEIDQNIIATAHQNNVRIFQMTLQYRIGTFVSTGQSVVRVRINPISGQELTTYPNAPLDITAIANIGDIFSIASMRWDQG